MNRVKSGVFSWEGGGGNRVGYSPGTREPGSHEIFRLTRNFCSISRCFGTNLTSRSVFPVIWRYSSYHTHAWNIFLSQEETSWHWNWLIAKGRNLLSQKGIFYQGQKFTVTRRNFLLQEEISCHRKKLISCHRKIFLVRGRNLLSQEEISLH